MVVLSTISLPGSARIAPEGPSVFRNQVEDYLRQAEQDSPHTAALIDRLRRTVHTVVIRPITDDPETWHSDGSETRSHTRRIIPEPEEPSIQGAIVYINTNRIRPDHKTYRRGTLIHELVHALDLVENHYHPDYTIRERRAVFFQNLWRDARGHSLRRHYHHRFPTLEYQKARQNTKIADYVDYLFTHDNLPGLDNNDADRQ